MQYPLKELLQKFSSSEIDVTEFQRTLGEWNRFGLWEGLTKQESKLLSKFFYQYFDKYAGETLPKYTRWERFKRNMYQEPNVDLPLLKQGTAELLTALERQSPRHGSSADT